MLCLSGFELYSRWVTLINVSVKTPSLSVYGNYFTLSSPCYVLFTLFPNLTFLKI